MPAGAAYPKADVQRLQLPRGWKVAQKQAQCCCFVACLDQHKDIIPCNHSRVSGQGSWVAGMSPRCHQHGMQDVYTWQHRVQSTYHGCRRCGIYGPHCATPLLLQTSKCCFRPEFRTLCMLIHKRFLHAVTSIACCCQVHSLLNVTSDGTPSTTTHT